MNNQNKKILLVITKSNFGGAQKYVLELAKDLTKHGLCVQVAVGGNGILVSKLQDAQIDTIIIPNLERDVSLLKDFQVFLNLYTIIKKQRPDVVHLNSSKIGALGALAARIARVPKTIFTIHGWAFNEDRGLISKELIKLIYVFTLLFSNNVIAVSKIVQKQAAALPFYFLFSHKIKIIHNGIETPVFLSKDKSLELLSHQIKIDLSNKKIIGQIAELHPIKSIETTIAAAQLITQKHKDTVFLIIGDGQERNSLQKIIFEKGLQDRVFLTGFIDNAATYLNAFDIFCLTSKSEALALVLIEAGLAHIPVVASQVGGIPELIEDNKTGFLFESGNITDLVQRIDYVLSLSLEKKEEVTNAFFEKIQKGFLIEHMSSETIKLY